MILFIIIIIIKSESLVYLFKQNKNYYYYYYYYYYCFWVNQWQPWLWANCIICNRIRISWISLPYKKKHHSFILLLLLLEEEEENKPQLTIENNTFSTLLFINKLLGPRPAQKQIQLIVQSSSHFSQNKTNKKWKLIQNISPDGYFIMWAFNSFIITALLPLILVLALLRGVWPY